MFGAGIKSLFGGRLLFNGENRLGSKEDLVRVLWNRPCGGASRSRCQPDRNANDSAMWAAAIVRRTADRVAGRTWSAI